MDDLELLRQLGADVPPPTAEARAAARARLDAVIEAADTEDRVVTTMDEVIDVTQTQLPTRPSTSNEPTRRHWLGIAAGVIALLVAGAAIAWIVTARDDPGVIVNEGEDREPSGDGAPEPGRPTSDLTRAAAGAFPQDVAFAAGSLWVSNHGGAGKPTSLMRFDPVTMELEATIAPPDGTRFLCALTAGDDGSVISTVCGTGDDDFIARFDPATGAFDVVHDVDGFALGATYLVDGSLWVLTDPASTGGVGLRRVDITTGDATDIDLGVVNPRWSAVGAGSLWITSLAQADLSSPFVSEVLRVDLATGELQARIPVGGAPQDRLRGGGGDNGPQDIVTTAEGVYVSIPGEGAVVRIDPATNAVAGRVQLVTSRPDLAMPILGAAPDALWARLPDGSVVELTLGTLEVGTPITIGPVPQFTGDILVTADHVFVARQTEEGEVVRLDR